MSRLNFPNRPDSEGPRVFCSLPQEEKFLGLVDQALNASIEKGVEVGLRLCEDGASDLCIGDVCTLPWEKPPCEKPQTSFHTHPSGVPWLSPKDLRAWSYFGEDYACVGTPERTIRCWAQPKAIPGDPPGWGLHDAALDLNADWTKALDKYKCDKGLSLRELLRDDDPILKFLADEVAPKVIGQPCYERRR